jgi:hypothetical protein
MLQYSKTQFRTGFEQTVVPKFNEMHRGVTDALQSRGRILQCHTRYKELHNLKPCHFWTRRLGPLKKMVIDR